jgi:hypothetical protein
MSTTEVTRRENLIMYAFWLGPVGPTDKENQVKMYKTYCFRYITSLKRQRFGYGSVSNSRIRIRIKWLNEKDYWDPYQKGLDPQHWLRKIYYYYPPHVGMPGGSSVTAATTSPSRRRCTSARGRGWRPVSRPRRPGGRCHTSSPRRCRTSARPSL